MAGYSGTPLAKKLGINSGARVSLLDAPAGFEATLDALPADARISRRLVTPSDVVVLFATKQADLARRLPAAVKALAPAGGLWLTWPKKASGLATDLTEAFVHAAGLATGLVDNKVCAISETFSGLRFVVRLKDRPHAR